MDASITLPSNGFGRFEQQIVFSIQEGQRESLPDDLDMVPLADHSSPLRSFYLWRRWSARKGDDEDIIFALSATLGIDRTDWNVDWSQSIY